MLANAMKPLSTSPAPPKAPEKPTGLQWEPLFDEEDNQIGWHNTKTGEVQRADVSEPPAEAVKIGSEAPNIERGTPSLTHQPPPEGAKRITAGKVFWTLVTVAIPIVATVTCYNKEAQEAAREAQRAAEAQKALEILIGDATMVTEIDRLLREKIRLAPPFMAVHADLGSYALPVATPWVIECDWLGHLNIKFKGVPGDSSAVSATLFPGSLNEEQCGRLLTVTAQRYAAYIAGPAQEAAAK